jgi:hypothetical protein
VPNSEEEESKIQSEEQEEESHSRAKRADQEDGSEDEPAGEVEADGVVEIILVLVGVSDGEAAGSQDDGEGDPEAAVGGERGGTEGVADGHFPGGGRLAACSGFCVTGTGIGMVWCVNYVCARNSDMRRKGRAYALLPSENDEECKGDKNKLNWKKGYIPHAREQLNKSTIAKRKSNNEVGRSNTAGLEVDQGEDESSEGESGQAQRRRVGELAVRDLLVQTGLKLTTEGREADGLAGEVARERVSAIVVGANLVDAVGGAAAVVDGVDGGGFVVDRYGVGGDGGHGGG